jgi:hypothetical protein
MEKEGRRRRPMRPNLPAASAPARTGYSTAAAGAAAGTVGNESFARTGGAKARILF